MGLCQTFLDHAELWRRGEQDFLLVMLRFGEEFLAVAFFVDTFTLTAKW